MTGENGKRALRAIVLVAVGTLLSARVAAGQGSGCAAWPGEPSPLPAASSADPLLAHWASLRIAELAVAARAAEIPAPARAGRLWRHLLCIDPSSAEAAQALGRVRSVRVHRPDVVAVRAAPEPESTPGLLRLDDTIRVVSVTSPRPAAPTPAIAPPQVPAAPDWKRIDAALGSAEAQLRAANFEGALAAAQRVRRQLRDDAATQGARERQARAEVVAATAQIALGSDAAARQSFERALAANPALRLDPATTSPKVRRAFDAVLGTKGGNP